MKYVDQGLVLQHRLDPNRANLLKESVNHDRLDTNKYRVKG